METTDKPAEKKQISYNFFKKVIAEHKHFTSDEDAIQFATESKDVLSVLRLHDSKFIWTKPE